MRGRAAQAVSSVLPIVSRASIAAWAADASASANRWPTTGSRCPAAAACSARSDSARSCGGARPLPCTQRDPGVGGGLRRDRGERPAGHAEAREAPAGANELERLPRDRAADAVEDDVDRAGVGRPAGPRVVDRPVGAEPACEPRLALAARGRDDARARTGRELDEEAADAAGRGLDEHRLALLHGGRPRRA